MAARVKPPRLEKELVDMFMGTLHGFYYDEMVGKVTSRISNSVTIGERIESGIKSGKIQGHRLVPRIIQRGMFLTSRKRRKEKLIFSHHIQGHNNHW